MKARKMSVSWATLLLFRTLVLGAVTQVPDIRNTEIDTVVVAGNLRVLVEETAHSSAEPTWMAWTVPMVEGERLLCCWNRSGRGRKHGACPLENSRRQFVFTNDVAAFRPTAQAALAMVLLRAEDGKLDDIRIYSDFCPLDVAGRGLRWFDQVDPAASVRLLSELASGDSALTDKDLADEALMALALHDSAAADIVIEEMASAGHPTDRREEAIFWLGEARGQTGFEALERILDQEENSEVRSHVVFALSLLPGGQGTLALLEIARDGRQPASVRQEAIFWLAQSDDERALDLITEILRR